MLTGMDDPLGGYFAERADAHKSIEPEGPWFALLQEEVHQRHRNPKARRRLDSRTFKGSASACQRSLK
jgi:hypothetical protein